MTYIRAATAEGQIKLALEALSKKGVSEYCSRCREHQWTAELLALHATTMPHGFFPGGISGLQSYVPVLSLTCNNCGSIYLHNVEKLGIKL
jgi:hypothetical protein